VSAQSPHEITGGPAFSRALPRATKFRYRSARLTGLWIEMLTEDDLLPAAEALRAKAAACPRRRGG
jgi:hypothetical protein